MVNILHDLIYMIPISMVAVIAGKPYFGGPDAGAITYLWALLVLGICVMLKHVKSRMKYILPGVGVILGAGLVALYSMQDWKGLWWNVLWLFLVTMTAVLSYYVGRLLTASRLIRRIVAFLSFAGLILLMVLAQAPDRTMVLLIMFLLVVFAANEVQGHWKKSGYSDMKGHIVSIAPFFIVLILIVGIFPAAEEPYDWGFAVKIWEKAVDIVNWAGSLFHGGEDDYSAVVGFSDSGSFWGELSKDQKTEMVMTGKNNPGAVVYLRGKVMDTFDGRNWTDTYTQENRDGIIDSLETFAAVNKHDHEFIRNYIRRDEFKFVYKDFNTKYLFAPAKAILPWESFGEEDYTQVGGNLIADGSLGYGTEYVVPYYRLNSDHEIFKGLLRNAPKIDRESWDKARAKYEPGDMAGVLDDDRKELDDTLSYQAYLDYKDRVKKYYLKDVKLSAKVQDYMKKLMDGAHSDYDKLSRIEEALGAMTYNDSPGVLPENVNSDESYLDELLLNKQEGYCSYFATAFVLLARSQGIPARYVQGFSVKTNGFKTVNVESSQSHAWPEAYIEGVGWMSFEPTPGRKQRTSWSIFRESGNKWDVVGTMYDHRGEELPDRVVVDPSEKKESDGIGMGIILIPVIVLVIFIIVFMIADRIMASSRYKKQDDAGKFNSICRKNIKILELLGFKIKQGETLAEFRDRAGEKIEERALIFIGECELISYAEKPVDADMLRAAISNQSVLMAHLKDAKGKWYIWYKYKLSRM